MRLAIDCGNTHTDLGLFQYERGNMIRRWRFRSFKKRNVNEHRVLFRHFLNMCSVDKVETVTASCVCPELLNPIIEASREELKIGPSLVNSSLINAPPEAGSDRVANAISVMNFHQVPAVVVDFGTATAFDLIFSHGLESCVITQGVELFVKGQNSIAEQLPHVDFPSLAPKGMCKDTVTSMAAGLYQGYKGMVCGVIAFIKESISEDVTLISTGGGWKLVQYCMKGILDQHIPDLTLKGIDIAGLMLKGE